MDVAVLTQLRVLSACVICGLHGTAGEPCAFWSHASHGKIAGLLQPCKMTNSALLYVTVYSPVTICPGSFTDAFGCINLFIFYFYLFITNPRTATQ